jgi:L-arabinonolactonase
MQRIGDFTLTWGESLRWDDRRERLYFVDCAKQRLHWLEGGAPPLATMRMPSLPTGVVLTEGRELVVCLADGLYVVDADAEAVHLLTRYPDGMHGRANDANGDGAGNLVTGTLNVAPGPGGLWWFSMTAGWRQLDGDFGNANGPAVIDAGGERTLVFGDTLARKVYAYAFDGASGTVGERRVLADYAAVGGAPDGATADANGGVWSCVLRSGQFVRLTSAGIDRVIDAPTRYPSDIAFGGPDLRRLFMTSIAVDLGEGPPAEAAHWVVAIDDVDAIGQPEARFRL